MLLFLPWVLHSISGQHASAGTGDSTVGTAGVCLRGPAEHVALPGSSVSGTSIIIMCLVLPVLIAIDTTAGGNGPNPPSIAPHPHVSTRSAPRRGGGETALLVEISEDR